MNRDNLTDSDIERFLRWVFTPDIRERWRHFWTVFRALRRQDIIVDDSIDKAARGLLTGESYVWYHKMKLMDDRSDRLKAPMFMRLLFYKEQGYIFTAAKAAKEKP